MKVAIPLIDLSRYTIRKGAGPIVVYQHTPAKFLASMDRIYPELLDQRASPMEHRLCAFLTDGQFVGSFVVRMTAWGHSVSGPRKNPWLVEGANDGWMLRSHLAAGASIGCNFYSGFCRKGWNYGVLRYFQRLGLGGREVFNGRSVMTVGGTPETRAALEGFIAESRQNYIRVRQLAAERMKEIDPEEVLPRIEDFDSPVWSGSVEFVAQSTLAEESYAL